MAIDIKYFNSFVLKKTVNNQDLAFPNSQANRKSVFTGLPWNPSDYPAFIVSRADDVRVGKMKEGRKVGRKEGRKEGGNRKEGKYATLQVQNVIFL